MDPIIAALVAFLMMNLMVVSAMIRRIDVNNACVLEWEREQALQQPAAVESVLEPESV